MVTLKGHHVCIDRSIQHPQGPEDEEGEVGFSTMSREGGDIFLYILLKKSNLEKLVENYELKDL